MGLKQAIVIRADLGMGKGKIAAQSAHASVSCIEKVPNIVFEKWTAEGMKKIVLRVNSKMELLELFEKVKKLLPVALIKDAGLTQVKPGEPTCIAIGPAEESEINRFTKGLKLL